MVFIIMSACLSTNLCGSYQASSNIHYLFGYLDGWLSGWIYSILFSLDHEFGSYLFSYGLLGLSSFQLKFYKQVRRRKLLVND